MVREDYILLQASQKGSYDKVKAMVDFIAYADGKTDIIDISDKIGVPISELISVIKELNEAELIKYYLLERLCQQNN